MSQPIFKQALMIWLGTLTCSIRIMKLWRTNNVLAFWAVHFKGRKSIQMSASAGKTEHLSYRTPPNGCLLWSFHVDHLGERIILTKSTKEWNRVVKKTLEISQFLNSLLFWLTGFIILFINSSQVKFFL